MIPPRDLDIGHDELSHFEKFEGAFFNARMKIDLPPY
tara:strand:- start:3 stop:113 length:111 start_codon:yes stop_codon:yes gene_type:complete